MKETDVRDISDYTYRTHEIYAIKVWKQKLYIITAPADVAAAFKNTTSLNFDGHLNELLINFGFQDEALRLAWHVAKPGEACYLTDELVKPRQESLNRLTEEVYRQQLLPGPKMDVMCSVFLDALYERLQWTTLESCTVANFHTAKHVSLRSLCRNSIVDAAIRSMFGGHLHQIEPNIVQYMQDFNDVAWMVFFRYPDTFGSPVTLPRTKIIKALETFLELSDEEKPEQAWSIKTITAAQKIVGIDLRSRASIMLANSNEYNISFWIVTHLVFDKELMRVVKPEIQAAWATGHLDVKSLCANSPNLTALFQEALRLNGGAMVSRKVLHRTELGGKVLEPGNSYLRQLHKNEQVWGKDFNHFSAFRFAKKKHLARHSSYRPFGGGVTYCPGRVLAKEEVFGFVAMLLHQFNLDLAEGYGGKSGQQTFPKLDDSMPALGISGPTQSTDVILKMSLALLAERSPTSRILIDKLRGMAFELL
ncbi:MAG: hypothetical protein M1828_006526 [Chrysothrix sp. TS-e1954]|nr:MAG: hypothetical protein M1828_006526 [Chrysothrix sp. TS-e1954]